jgi:poly-gamma-glutamate synthesis protein (capsule biosynthesis protein)
MKNRINILMFCILFLFSCHSKPGAPAGDTELPAEPETSQRYTLTLVAAGDNLFHESIIRSALENGVYNFAPIYSEIKSIVENSDLAFINQETVMAGERFGYSGYPTFNTPQSLARTLADTGFDIVNQANNHAMDMGSAGLYATLDLWNTIEGITVIGARREGESGRLITKNNITLGFLSYTFSLNGIALPRDNPNLVSMINTNRMAREIDALRPLCDFLIVSMHWGDEYMTEPSEEQIELALFLAEHNVDLIIGHHPHVLQRAQTITLPDGRKTLCFFSLGNFVSHQRERERIIGAMMVVTFSKRVSSSSLAELSISDSGIIPVICHFNRNYANTKVYPLYSYSEELLKNHVLINFDSSLSINSFYSILNRMETRIIMRNPF